jgi:hypothetical protein
MGAMGQGLQRPDAFASGDDGKKLRVKDGWARATGDAFNLVPCPERRDDSLDKGNG